MMTNEYSETIVNESEAIDFLLNGISIKSLNLDCSLEEISKFNKYIKQIDRSDLQLNVYSTPTCSVSEFHNKKQKQWLIPESYKKINIDDYLMRLTKSNIEQERIQTELDLFHKNNMDDLIRLLIYLVDIMKENNIIWGVGRGSSVASYALYLIGVHKIDSIKYGLDIKEFIHEHN